jgi:molybdopterin synthase sulfur carrier subunit
MERNSPMAIKVRIPSPLRKLTKGQGEVEVRGHNVSELIETLETSYPGLKERICDEEGNLRRFINIYINEEDIRFLKGKDTPVKEGDEVSIIPAIAGGAEVKGDRVTSLKVHITFPEDKIKEPIIYEIGREYKVVTNIRKADVTEKTGWVDLELTGDPHEVERAVAGLKKKGVKVDPIEKNIIE